MLQDRKRFVNKLSGGARSFRKYSKSVTMLYHSKVCTKGMANEGDVNVGRTTNVHFDGG